MRRDIFSTMRAKKAAVRHGHPSRGVQLIVVAGSAGKTTTARLLAEILRESGKKVAVFTNRGSQIEVVPYTPNYSQSAETIQQALAAARKQRCDMVIMELAGCLRRPQILTTLDIDLALITGQGEDVDMLLDQPLKSAVLPSDFSAKTLPVAPHQLISVGENELAEARITDVKLYRKGTELRLTVDHQTVIEIATHLIGEANAHNAAFAAAASYVLGAPVEAIAEGVARLEELPGNFQVINQPEAYQLVVDGSASRLAVTSLVASAKQLAKRRLIVVCDTSVPSEVMQTIKPSVDRLISVSGHSQSATDEAASLEDAVAIAKRAGKKDDLILLVGQDFATLTANQTTRAHDILEINND